MAKPVKKSKLSKYATSRKISKGLLSYYRKDAGVRLKNNSK